jgi:hypothetical protein
MVGRFYWDGQLHLTPGDADLHRLIHKISNSSDSCVGSFSYSEYESPDFDVVKLVYSSGSHPDEEALVWMIRQEIQGPPKIAMPEAPVDYKTELRELGDYGGEPIYSFTVDHPIYGRGVENESGEEQGGVISYSIRKSLLGHPSELGYDGPFGEEDEDNAEYIFVMGMKNYGNDPQVFRLLAEHILSWQLPIYANVVNGRLLKVLMKRYDTAQTDKTDWQMHTMSKESETVEIAPPRYDLTDLTIPEDWSQIGPKWSASVWSNVFETLTRSPRWEEWKKDFFSQ